jgi:hypothetical protein
MPRLASADSSKSSRVSHKGEPPETGCDPLPNAEARPVAGGRTLAMQLRMCEVAELPKFTRRASAGCVPPTAANVYATPSVHRESAASRGQVARNGWECGSLTALLALPITRSRRGRRDSRGATCPAHSLISRETKAATYFGSGRFPANQASLGLRAPRRIDVAGATRGVRDARGNSELLRAGCI